MTVHHSYTDGELLQLLQQNDENAFTEIFNRYWDKTLAIAYNLTKDKSAAKEIIQDLFTGIWKRRNELSVSNLENYLATAIKFSFFKRVERERRRRVLEKRSTSLFVNDEAILDQEVEALFLQQYIQGLINQLPEKCRLVFQYSRVHQMNNAEIAATMGITEKTVEGHLTKGLKILRLQLQEGGLAALVGVAAVALH